jgi:uncharacterized protein
MAKGLLPLILIIFFNIYSCGAQAYFKAPAPLLSSDPPSFDIIIDYTPPKYAKKRKFKEREIYFKGNDFLIPGTLTIPKRGKKLPLVILIPGYGIYDRDCSVGSSKVFKDIAWGLASKKIAVIRYDKRSFIYASKITEFFNDEYTAYEDIITDAIAAVRLGKNTSKISPEKVYLAGHDLGGMLSPRIAGMAPGLKGLILLAANARPLEDLILEQIRLTGQFAKERNNYLNDSKAMSSDKIESQVARVKDPKLSLETPSNELPLNLSAKFWLDLRNYNHFASARNAKIPMLFLQGDNDFEVTLTDLNMWKEELKDYESAEFKTYSGVNHFFIEDSQSSSPGEYSLSGSFSNAVMEDMVKWIKKRKKIKTSKQKFTGQP